MVNRLKALVTGFFSYILERPKKVFFIALAGAFLVWIVFGDYGILARLRMEADNRMLRERYEKEEAEIEQNRQTLRQVSDPGAVEKTAREKYNFRKEGETLFIIREQ
ncbi:septum formation initiator family protein [Prosthecochloris sp. HL-130-GSB]|jgi:cell division protein FtsB|uniref:Septum formation initiator family protein n=1 Tax=Prosthecochloris aestuarii TaxID=1102 RepID=A0A831WUD7_PROAE|nr:septum formation initiator family protein [Prosthecochloris sp. HL-130-GSB]ARM30205.1 septum formation initiator [Prosthecochloris sp. HL-130-GSB]MBO8091806.1 septum formation initiator family protein [Prosthecochloris sp.]HED30656.1 septum formation initiator family protein [Prosthecochloris aestuarii]